MGTLLMFRPRPFCQVAVVVIAVSSAVFLFAGDAAGKSGISASASNPRSMTATRAYATLGTSLGTSGIVLWHRSSPPHLFVGGVSTAPFGVPQYWIELGHDTTSNDYRQIYVSPFYPMGIEKMAIGEAIKTGIDQLVLGLSDGSVQVIDLVSKQPIAQFQTAAGFWPDNNIRALRVVDLDGDGVSEILLTTAADFYVYRADGVLLWSIAGAGGYDIAVGQMDDDPGLEVATFGKIIDAATRSIQWSPSTPFGYWLQAFDIDGDGRDELIGSYGAQWGAFHLAAFDVNARTVRWQTPVGGAGGVVRVASLQDRTGAVVIAGQNFNGPILVCDPQDGVIERTIDARGTYIADLVVGDVDGDGHTELVWATGADGGAADNLRVVDFQTGTEKWINIDFDGPFIGPEVGDLDGDGTDEVVILSSHSDSGYAGGRLVVLDGATLTPRAVSEPIGFFPLQDFRLRDVDGDGRMEIVVGSEANLQGVVEIYRFDADNTFHRIWENLDRPEGVHFQSVDVADIDGDGSPEVIAGGSRDISSSTEVAVYVYDCTTGREKWKFNGFNINSFWVRSVAVLPPVPGERGRDFAAREENGDVYILNGRRRTVRAVFRGAFSSLEPIIGGPGVLLLGDSSGMVWTIDRHQSEYSVVSQQRVASSRLDGAVRLSDGRTAVGFGGRLSLFAKLSEPSIWTSALYGEVFGRRTVLLRGRRSVLMTTGSYSLEAFPVNGQPQFK